jgi:hypothetical protein
MMKQNAKEISILELEQELAADEAFDEMATSDTLEFPAVAEPTDELDDDTDTAIYEISPPKLARWLSGQSNQYWIAIA